MNLCEWSKKQITDFSSFITCGYHSPSLLNVESISPLMIS
uniref:Uncharacterized protein n=1 Tax=Arundo donax TaxID=35708 RepID=A0A0A9BBR1_ARUDO